MERVGAIISVFTLLYLIWFVLHLRKHSTLFRRAHGSYGCWLVDIIIAVMTVILIILGVWLI
jgi:hypothetical protein